jgi:hypothetical protein
MSYLMQLAYTSASLQVFTVPELITLLDRARDKNKRLGITGMLLYVENSFFQVLEGESEVVLPLYQEIVLDPRHTSVTTVIAEPLPERAFPDWTMGFSTLSREDFLDIPGLNDFGTESFTLTNLDDLRVSNGRAKMLLHGFTQGRWRTRLIGDTWLPASDSQASSKAPKEPGDLIN